MRMVKVKRGEEEVSSLELGDVTRVLMGRWIYGRQHDD